MKKIIDWIVTAILLILFILAFITGSGGSIQLFPLTVSYGETGLNVLNGITTLTIAILGIITVFDICLSFRLEHLVPSFIIKAKKRNEEEIIKRIIDSYSDFFDKKWEDAAKKAIDLYYGEDFSRYSELLEVYFEKDFAFVKSSQQARTDYILEKLGLTQSRYDEALDCLIRLRAMPLTTTQDAVDRMEHILQGMPGIIIQQQEKAADRTYKEVQFYLDFVSSMREDEYGKEIAETFARYILLSMKEDKINGITKIVIPSDSNFLLGFKVGESLGYPQVIMRNNDGRIFKNQPWDGELKHSDKVIIVHDVLVSGAQVVSAMKKIKGFGVEVSAVYCIVNRLEYRGEDEIYLENGNCKVKAMLELNDRIINKKYYKRKKRIFFIKKQPRIK